MSHAPQWRKAIIFALIFHIFLVIGAGYLVDHMPISQAAEEKYVELELMAADEPQALTDSVPSDMPISTSPLSQSLPLPPQSKTSSSSTAPSLNGTVTTEGLTLTSFSSASAMPSSDQVAGNNAQSSGVKSTGNGIIPPSILDKVAPAYPQSARLAGIEGTAILSIQIYENGLPGAISIFRSSGNEELDNAAIRAVKQWRFIPAKDRATNQPLTCSTKMPISFHLK